MNSAPENTGTRETIAVLGAGGTMGLAMARRLLQAGYSVRAWNRSAEKAEPLADEGAVITDTAAAAANQATFIITMLADGDAVLAAMAEVEPGAGDPTPLWVQMSTVGEGDTERCVALARDRSLAFIDAPVSGTKAPAEQGELVILASGPEDLRARTAPIFQILGHKTMWAGVAGDGTRLKLAVNSWLLSVVEGAAETLALAEGLGLDPRLVLDTVADGPLDAPYLQMKGQAMIERSFDPSFALKLAAKDAGLAVDAAERRGLDLPMLVTIRERFDTGAAEHPDDDLSATFLTSVPTGQNA